MHSSVLEELKKLKQKIQIPSCTSTKKLQER